MNAYETMTPQQRQQETLRLRARYEALRDMDLRLDMSRGKPGKEQLDLVSGMLTVLQDPADCLLDETDVRNYGQLSGLRAAKELFSDILGCKASECFVGGNASLQLMYDTIAKAYTHGLLHSPRPWSKEACVRFLCPSPGYDRHFKISQSFGMELITIPMLPTGPDMDLVEAYVKDPQVKGIWCVPKYSNPDGIIYDTATVARLAALRPAAPDFALMWDNAYCVHEFEGEFVPFADILSLCRAHGNADMVYEFASTSKVTFAGAGVAMMASSKENAEYIRSHMTVQTIGPDKINQLRHVKFFKNFEGLTEHMKKHQALLAPRFAAVLDGLDKEIAPYGIGSWTKPNGGYFISFDALDGCAKRIVELCKEAGVVLTGAGATFPYKKDPKDSNIRIAPSYPPVDELKLAVEIFTTAVKLASAEKLLSE